MKLNIIKRTTVSALLSLGIMLLGLVFAVVNGGLNLGVDFTGGQLVTVQFEGDYESADIEQILGENNAGEVIVMRSDNNSAVIRMPEKDEEELSALNGKLLEGLKEKNYNNVEISGIDRVGAVASRDLIINAFLSVGIAALLILIYIWIRFELFSGIAAVLALVHDVLIMLAFVSIFRIPINSSFIAAVLTIIGYSINSTILVFDQVRENRKLFPKMSNADLINKSVSETFWRSINTSVTTLITVAALYLFAVPSIKEFTLPIIVGLLAGAFSSIVLAGQWWYFMRVKIGHDKQ